MVGRKTKKSKQNKTQKSKQNKTNDHEKTQKEMCTFLKDKKFKRQGDKKESEHEKENEKRERKE